MAIELLYKDQVLGSRAGFLHTNPSLNLVSTVVIQLVDFGHTTGGLPQLGLISTTLYLERDLAS